MRPQIWNRLGLGGLPGGEKAAQRLRRLPLGHADQAQVVLNAGKLRAIAALLGLTQGGFERIAGGIDPTG